MANVQKYTLDALGHMLNHYGRQENDGVTRSNKDIDNSRTCNNYNLAPRHYVSDRDGCKVELSSMDFIRRRLSEVKHRNLSSYKDNVMCDWVVTLPQDIKDADTFFRHVYDFLADKYGEKNVISAYVHKDETTPHIHFAFLPIVKDEKTGGEKLCAKQLITRAELMKFHPALQSYVEDKMGQSVGILNGATAGGNLTIIELKMRDALKKLADVEAKTGSLETAQPIIEETLKMMTEVTDVYRKLDEALKAKKWFGDDDKAKMKEVTNELDEIKASAEKARETATLLEKTLKGLDGNVNSHLDDVFKKMNDMEKAAQRRIKRTERKLSRREERVSQKEQSLEREIRQGVKNELAKLDEHINRKKSEAEALDEEINRKKQQLKLTDTDFWARQEYLRTAQVHQHQFTATLQEWQERGLQNESKNAKSTRPKS